MNILVSNGSKRNDWKQTKQQNMIITWLLFIHHKFTGNKSVVLTDKTMVNNNYICLSNCPSLYILYFLPLLVSVMTGFGWTFPDLFWSGVVMIWRDIWNDNKISLQTLNQKIVLLVIIKIYMYST